MCIRDRYVLDEMGAGEGPGADDVQLAVDDLVGVDEGVAGVGVLADDQVRAAAAGQGEALGDGGGHSGALDDEVGPGAAGGGADLVQHALGVAVPGDVDVRVADAGPGGEGQPFARAADDDDLGGPGELGEGRGGEADGAAALDDHDLAEPYGPPFVQRVDDGGARAGEGHGGERVDALGRLDHGGAGLEDDVVGPRAGQLGAVGQRAVDAVGAAVLAQGRFPVQPARRADAAGDGGGPHHRVAGGERRAGRVPVLAGAEFADHAVALVAQDEGGGDGQVPLLEAVCV